MKLKILLLLSSILFSLIIFEIILRILHVVPEINPAYNRQDVAWTEKNVILNSAGYRSKEYPKDRSGDTFRIYAIGDSYTYGWLINNPNDTYPALIEKGLSEKTNKKVEVINAGQPGFSIIESVNRYETEGKFYHPDLVLFGIDDLRISITNGFVGTWDPPLPEFIKNTEVYQVTIGNLIRKITDNRNEAYLESIFKDKNSKDFQAFSKQLVSLRNEAAKINAKVALVVFPHINPKNPNKPYSIYEYNQRLAEFGKENGILVFDPLQEFLNYKNKTQLFINPLDAHPTAQMDQLIANAFLKGFDLNSYIQNHKTYTPIIETANISRNNKSIGPYQGIRKIYSDGSSSFGYFETKNGTEDLPLTDDGSRQTKIYEDRIQTVKTFTADNVIGASILYYVKPKKAGQVVIPARIYGYKVAGLENIFGIINGKDGHISADYIEPKSFIKKGDNIVLNYDPKKTFYVLRLSLPVSVTQLDIDSSGNVVSIAKIQQLETTLEKDSTTVTFPINETISGLPQFFQATGNTYSYAFINDKFEKLQNAVQNDKSVTLNFPKNLKKGDRVTFPLFASYELTDSDNIKVEVER